MIIHRGASLRHPLLVYIQQVRAGMGDADTGDVTIQPFPPPPETPTEVFLPPSAPVDILPPGGGAIIPDTGGSTPQSGAGSTTDWTKIFQSLIQGGVSIAKQVSLPAGSYVTSYIDPRTGAVMYTQANNVPGAVPGQNYSLGAGQMNLGPILLLGGLGLGGLLLVKAMSRR